MTWTTRRKAISRRALNLLGSRGDALYEAALVALCEYTGRRLSGKLLHQTPKPRDGVERQLCVAITAHGRR